MRPLSRGPSTKKYKDYKRYHKDLLRSYGPFCAYCEKKDYDLDVEHVEPKSVVPAKTTDWNNLLLGCVNCNRDFKKSWNKSRSGYIFPDLNETFKVFHYRADGTISAVTAAAVETRQLCGLNRPAAISNRQDALKRAIDTKREVLAGTRRPEDVIVWAATLGHWSVWVSVYHDVPAMMTLLCDPQHFPGTRVTFLHPVNRPRIKI